MYLSTFLKNEYLTSTCTWYIFVVLGVLESTVLNPNPDDDHIYYHLNDRCTCMIMNVKDSFLTPPALKLNMNYYLYYITYCKYG